MSHDYTNYSDKALRTASVHGTFAEREAARAEYARRHPPITRATLAPLWERYSITTLRSMAAGYAEGTIGRQQYEAAIAERIRRFPHLETRTTMAVIK